MKDIVLIFQNKVITSKIERDSKLKLLSLGASMEAFSEFLQEAGGESIKKVLSQMKGVSTSPNKLGVSPNAYGQPECEINWRNVMGGALVGFYFGVVGGGYAGAVGGSVTLPGFGTATGFVGGAVFGGAGGFVGGALQGIAQELLLSCFS